jgi:two-component system, sensor histidine kinase PdtaS
MTEPRSRNAALYLRSQNNLVWDSDVDAKGHHSEPLAEMFQLGNKLRAEDVALLQLVAEGLDLLADISRSDLHVYVKAQDHALLALQSRPTSVPPLYSAPMVGQTVDRQASPSIHRALFEGRMSQGIRGRTGSDTPTVLETFPIWNEEREMIAVLASETSLIEYERHRRKNPVFKETISRLRQQLLAGQLHGAKRLGRLGEHYASIVIDSSARVLYMSSLAEQLYRKLGYNTSLLGRRLSELDTNEHICFKALERDICLEQQIDEHNLVWVKRAVPLSSEPASGIMSRLLVKREGVGSALILIEDITEEHRKEQALRVKSALIREIHHRVKNNLQTIAALLRMQARRTGSPEVLDMLKQSINRILSIALVHEFLSKDDASGEASLINIRDVTQQMLSEVVQGILDPEKNIRITLEGADLSLPAQQATSCALVINELLQNAVEHGFASKNEGSIRVILQETNGQMAIDVIDTGEGLPPAFDVERDGSLGLQIIRTLVKEDMKGLFTMCSDESGVHARISFRRQPGLEN